MIRSPPPPPSPNLNVDRRGGIVMSDDRDHHMPLRVAIAGSASRISTLRLRGKGEGGCKGVVVKRFPLSSPKYGHYSVFVSFVNARAPLVHTLRDYDGNRFARLTMEEMKTVK